MLFATDCCTAYISIFQLAYKVTEGAEKLKEVIEVESIGLPFLIEGKWIQRMLRSIPVLSVNIGGFHEAERESVPIFLNFVVQQIVGLLITF